MMISDAQLSRMTDEHDALNDRMVKLSAFVDSARFADLTPEHQFLLRAQLDTMSAYARILTRRLVLLGVIDE